MVLLLALAATSTVETLFFMCHIATPSGTSSDLNSSSLSLCVPTVSLFLPFFLLLLLLLSSHSVSFHLFYLSLSLCPPVPLSSVSSLAISQWPFSSQQFKLRKKKILWMFNLIHEKWERSSFCTRGSCRCSETVKCSYAKMSSSVWHLYLCPGDSVTFLLCLPQHWTERNQAIFYFPTHQQYHCIWMLYTVTFKCLFGRSVYSLEHDDCNSDFVQVEA